MVRWTAKVKYCMKIYLFRNEFKLSASEKKNLFEFCVFAAHVYVYREHLTKTAGKLKNRNNLLMKLAGSTWGASANVM